MITNRKLNATLLALLALVIVYTAAFVGNMATMPSIPTWYATLNKPFFNPPNWIFGPVWAILYSLLAFSLWRVLRVFKTSPDAPRAVLVFAIQMILNPLWSIVFFYFHAPLPALFVVVALEISILAMIFSFARVDRIAAMIQWPYAAWVGFATLLNAAIVMLN